jgi:hypothetical protein
MYYSTYVRVLVSVAVAVTVLVGVVAALAVGWLAVVIVPIFALIMGVACYLSIAWMDQAMDNFGGSPMPGFWGLMGINIVPDGTDLSQLGYQPPDYDANELPGFSDTGESKPAPPPVRRGCPSCGAVTQGTDAKVCRVCGAPLEA